ncbi:rhoptry protein [Clostridium putrefaciens]|uniref:Rhoptry protein n=1 Tax=Clostridium putrefaciens TaxID=99675 RepID=A0A381J7L8_9CLOT|nr:hypothetical protein [Clostridium putrefaciens]SUY46310.1 rhoptry protein [Clostridium putrefaciens]
MGSIINVNNPYGVDDKKITSKLTFQKGESFSARVVGHGNSKNEVSLRMIDGWQFDAQIDGNIGLDYKGTTRFVVEGFENNKLKIKALKVEVTSEDNIKKSIDLILEENGLTKSDSKMLLKMLKNNIELNKENILKAKTLIDLKENILPDSSKERDFIFKYINSKHIDISSEQGKAIERVLKESFQEIKDLSIDDIMFMIENDLPLDKETMESFKNMFKENGKLYDLLKEIDIDKSLLMSSDTLEMGNLDKDKVETILLNAIKETLNMEVNINKDDIGALTSSLNKFSKENILKGIQEVVNLDKINIDAMLKDVLSGELHQEGFKNLTSLIDGSKEQILNNKDQLKSQVKEILPKDLTLTENEINNLIDAIEHSTESKSFAQFKQSILSVSQKVTEGVSGLNNLNGDNILNLVSKENVYLNETTRFLMNLLEDKGKGDSNNLKAEIKEILTSIMDDDMVRITNKGELQIKDSASMVKSQIDIKLNNMKNIINNILNKSLEGKDSMNNILSFIKDNLNDFKLYNTISNEYYYMDLPVSMNHKEYPCRVIIKDRREEGKKIDSKDVKMMVTVRTQFLGEVDGFIKVKNDFMDLEIKCDEKSIKMLNIKKELLKESLEGLGYSCDLKVSKKEVISNIVSCREFFNDSDFTSLNVMV